MAIIEEKRGDFEIKSVIDEMYYCREDEIIHLPREKNSSISLDELAKLPQDIRNELMEKLSKRDLECSQEDIDDEEELYKKFYTARI